MNPIQHGLARTEVSLRDGGTDKAFLTEVLDRPELTAREPVDPSWLNRLVESGEHLPRRLAGRSVLEMVLENLPSRAELEALVAPYASEVVYRHLDNFWLLEYELA